MKNLTFKSRFLVLFIVLLTMCVTQVWGGQITITASALGLDGTYRTNVTGDVGGVTFQWTDLMISTSRIQAKASSGVIQNTTALPGNISSIVVNHDGTARSTTISFGTTSACGSESDTWNGSKTHSPSGSYKYFKITRGSNAAYWTSIVINYEDAPSTPCTITFNAGSNGTCSTSNLTEASAGAGVTLPSVTANPGYYFIGWATTDDATDAGSGMTATQTYNPSGDITLYAVYGYEVEWYINGSKEETAQYKKGASLALPTADTDIECGGKVFVGWTNEANKNYSHATNAPGVLFTSASGTVTAPAKYYAVFATGSAGGTKWVKTAASAVNSAGVYAIITTDGHAFNGTISSGHGQVTSTAFSFDKDNFATSAPAGTCEITMTAVTGGFTMYNASNGYLYSNAASSGNLAWHNTESSYWLYKSSNWLYNSNSAYLRDYQNSSIRTYGANNGSVIQFAKKISNTTYTDYVTVCGPERGPCATPTFSQEGGSYCGTQSVTISCSTGGASIYYTTDGTTPTSSSTLYSSAISVSADMTIKAIAVKDGLIDSEVATATYSITNLRDTFIDNLHENATQYGDCDNYTVPSLSDATPASACEGEHYHFVGWSSAQLYTGQHATEPAGLLKAGSHHNADGTTYYAVWAKEQ